MSLLMKILNTLRSVKTADLKQIDKLVIESLLKNTKYYIDWYSFKEGNYLKTDYIKTNFNGTLKLNFPTLSSDNPTVWYVVHKHAYSGMIKNETPSVEERVSFEFQPIENDTLSILFKNAIFPNPFQNEIIVNSLENDTFILITPTGNIIFQSNIYKGNNKIKIGDLPIGLYFVRLINQNFVTKLERR